MRVTLLSGLAAAAVLAGCGQAHSENGGPTVERDYSVGNFDRIDLAGAYDVTVRTGSDPSVHAKGNEKAVERLVVEVRDGILTIHPRKHNGFPWGFSNSGKVNLQITVPALRGAELAGAGDLRIDKVTGDRFTGSITGAGNLTVDQLEVGDLNIAIAGSGDAKASNGRAKKAEYEITGSGGIDAAGIATQTASVSIAGSGDVMAHASDSADVNIMGSGNVEVKGGAKCSVSKAGSGDVRCG
jgi:hypothetical protein